MKPDAWSPTNLTLELLPPDSRTEGVPGARRAVELNLEATEAA